MKTTTQVKKWGNSLAIRIPARVARELGLSDDSQVELTTDGDMATIKRGIDPKKSLDALVSQITSENLHGEADWGTPVGNEVW